MTTVQNMEDRSMGYFYFIALVAALGGGLFGYDTAVISGTISMVVGQFGLTPSMEGTYVGCALIGSIAGVVSSGLLFEGGGQETVADHRVGPLHGFRRRMRHKQLVRIACPVPHRRRCRHRHFRRGRSGVHQ